MPSEASSVKAAAPFCERARGEHGGHSRPRQLAHDLEADAAIGTRDEGNAWVRHDSISFAC